jgi:hypothetical protein
LLAPEFRATPEMMKKEIAGYRKFFLFLVEFDGLKRVESFKKFPYF